MRELVERTRAAGSARVETFLSADASSTAPADRVGEGVADLSRGVSVLASWLASDRTVEETIDGRCRSWLARRIVGAAQSGLTPIIRCEEGRVCIWDGAADGWIERPGDASPGRRAGVDPLWLLDAVAAATPVADARGRAEIAPAALRKIVDDDTMGERLRGAVPVLVEVDTCGRIEHVAVGCMTGRTLGWWGLRLSAFGVPGDLNAEARRLASVVPGRTGPRT